MLRRAIQHGDCLQRYPNYDPSDPNATDPCLTSNWPMMILFGAIQVSAPASKAPPFPRRSTGAQP